MRSKQLPIPFGTPVKIADGPLTQLLLSTNGTVYLGGPWVTNATGFRWFGSYGPLATPLLLLESLWGVAEDAGVVVYVLEPGLL